MIGGAGMTWCARQREVVPMSSTEAEYISICTGVKELRWIRRLVQGVGIVDGVDDPTTMLVDNQTRVLCGQDDRQREGHRLYQPCTPAGF